MSRTEIGVFIMHPTADQDITASTQNQASSTLLSTRKGMQGSLCVAR